MPFEKNRDSAPPPPNLPVVAIAVDAARLSILRPSSLPLKRTCRIVRQIIAELALLLGDRVVLRRDSRRVACHIRQIAMYVCHVSLRLSLSDIGEAFGRDRTTVGHACHVVEDRRDEPAFDEFVSAVERMVAAVFGLSEVPAHE